MADKKRLPFRDDQFKLLECYVTSKWPVLLVYGQKGSGKKSVVRTFLDNRKENHCWISMAECPSEPQMFTSILNGFLIGTKEKSDHGLDSDQLCGSYLELIMKIKESKSTLRKDVIFVLDLTESSSSDTQLIESLCSLHEHIECSLTIILISCQMVGFGKVLPVSIEFPCYTKVELTKILLTDKPSEYSVQFYENYLLLTLSVIYHITRNLAEVKYICDSNFAKYIEPLQRCEVSEKESSKLWRKFEPFLRESVQQISLKGHHDNNICEELTFCAKYLLIAAFLASYNSVKTDKRFFVKYQGHSRSRRFVISKDDKKLSGPKAFTSERLIHIYSALLELNYDSTTGNSSLGRLDEPTNQLLLQVENLAGLRLLVRINQTGSALSSVRKWRVSDALTLDYMHLVAKSVRFDLMSHLEHMAYKQ